MTQKGKLEARNWTSAMLALWAAFLAAAATFVVQRVPFETRIPLDWTQLFNIRSEPVGVWGLFVAPAMLIALGLLARTSTVWLPRRTHQRHMLWYVGLGVMMTFAVIQYVLVRDAFHAAGSL